MSVWLGRFRLLCFRRLHAAFKLFAQPLLALAAKQVFEHLLLVNEVESLFFTNEV